MKPLKIFKRILLLIVIGVIVAVIYNYPKLNLISGYAAKSTAASVFVGNRSLAYTDSTDNNFGPINIAKNKIDITLKKASSSVFGLQKRTAIHREGLGTVLVNKDYDPNTPYLRPERYVTLADTILPYPYGDTPKDSIFSNINYERLNKAVAKAFDKDGISNLKTRSVLVLYKEHIIAEKYAEGIDKDSRLLGWSMTKSVLSTLFGIMEKQKKIDIHTSIPIEEWSDDSRSKITISDLLQMNSGLDWSEDYGQISDVTKMLFLASDMSSIQLEKKAITNPGTNWNYSSGTSNLLSNIMRQKIGDDQEYLNFPYHELIDKIGMHSMLLEADLAGNYIMSSYGWATTRDWAKYGLLHLNKGNWMGTQIFDPSWIDYINTASPGSNGTYGGHFWLNKEGDLPDAPRDLFYARGFQGQRVFIIPSKEMVVVRFGLEPIDFNSLLNDILNAVN